jgi:hypothetical protein
MGKKKYVHWQQDFSWVKEAIRAFREYMKYREEIPNELSRIRRILNTIAVSSSECERGFSQMNLIVTPWRSSLLVKTIEYLLFIIIIGGRLSSIVLKSKIGSQLWKTEVLRWILMELGKIFPHGSLSWILLEKPPNVQPLKNFPTFYGTRRLITVFTRALHWSLSWAR